MTPLEELALLLRPAAGGLYLVSTGRDAQLALQRRLYGASSDGEVDAKFRETLARIASAKVAILGVPSDVGAGFRRGANLGPHAIREEVLRTIPHFPERARKHDVVDIGDVFVVPQLLHDDMLSDAQKDASRRALYPSVDDRARAKLPVGPLSIAERALDLVFAINPRVRPFVLGGDHSCAWPTTCALARSRKGAGEPWGIVQPDAHTDLLEERLGIRYCFATWSFHANELIGRKGRLVQLGTRASRFPREHWEKTCDVRQFWADECRQNPDKALDAIIAHVKNTGVKGVYFSNDIDGTDAEWADATGTPEPGGLTPDFLVEAIRRLGREIGIVAADIMEVAPPLGPAGGPTLPLAARYFRETLDAMLGTSILRRRTDCATGRPALRTLSLRKRGKHPMFRSKFSSLFAISVVFALGACGRPATPEPAPGARDDAAIGRAVDSYLALVVARFPEQATELGLHDRDADLDDYTPAGYDAATAAEEALLVDVKSKLASPVASPQAKTDLSILTHTLDVDAKKRRSGRALFRKASVYAEPLDALFIMLTREYAPAPERATNAVARMEKIPAILAAGKANLAAGVNAAPDDRPPRVWTQVGIEVAHSASAFFDEQRGNLQLTLPKDTARVDAAVANAKAAYADFEAFLTKEILPKSTGKYAVGREFFDYLLKDGYFLDEDASGVLALGKQIFASTQRELDTVAKRIDPSAKGWPEVAASLKKNHPKAETLIPSYRDEVARARAFLVKKDVVPLPPGECEVIETPPFQRSTITAAYDQPPPFDDKVSKGFFFVTPVDKSLPAAEQEAMLRENDHADQVDTVVHEAYPGHHLQLSFARRHPSRMRRATDAAIFAEGWGLYSEQLMGELGYYTDEERLMQLEWALVRAARILIDVGLQTQGMSYEDAVKLLTDEVHLERPLAESEVKRYTMNPTQPLAYIVGREAIVKLREAEKKRLGTSFSLKKFHTELLSHGTIPPGLIAREIEGG